MTVECQAEDCHNVAAVTTYWPHREHWCWTHYKDGCTCEDDRDDPLCVVHGDPRDTSMDIQHTEGCTCAECTANRKAFNAWADSFSERWAGR